MANTATPMLLTSREAAEALRISRSNFHKLLRDSRLRSVVIGRRRMFDPQDLRDYIEKCKT